LDADVWIGAHVVIMPGVHLGVGAVVGAGSVVTQDVEPYGIAVGAPARQLSYRIDPELIPDALSLRWWTWPRETLREAISLFRTRLDRETLDALKERSKARP
jgi:hypothetical protein